jgi:hypothetical protein
MILKKQMVLSLIETETVRIIHPSDLRSQMKQGTGGGGNLRGLFLLVIPCFLQEKGRGHTVPPLREPQLGLSAPRLF